MSVVYVADQGARITKESRRLVVSTNDRIVLEIPDFKIDRLVIMGNVHITTPALSFLLDRGIETSFLTTMGRLRGRLLGRSSKNVFLRVRQFKRASDGEYCFAMAKSFVRGKIAAMAEVAGGTRAAARLRGMVSLVDRKDGVDALRGVEGFASSVYFSDFAQFFSADFGFPGRLRRPAPDPVNACLSLGYTLVGNEISSMLEAHGVDPQLGFYHRIAYGRPSLALDILEEFRHTAVDPFVKYLFGRNWLGKNMYERTDRGVRLTKEALKTYLAGYEKRISPHRIAIRRQCEKMVNSIKTGEVYVPYVLSGNV